MSDREEIKKAKEEWEKKTLESLKQPLAERPRDLLLYDLAPDV